MKSIKVPYLIVFLSLSAILFLAATVESEDKIVGLWLTGNGKAKIKIEKTGPKFWGKIVWIGEPADKNGKPKTDKNNPDEKLRNTPIIGLRLLKDFVYDENNLWKEGTIYDPESGNTYSCKLTLKDHSTLEVRGYVGLSLFGRTDIWKRQKE